LCLTHRSHSRNTGIRRTLIKIVAREEIMGRFWRDVWLDEEGQDIAEYAVMLAVILVIVVGTVRLIGSNANNVFSQVGSALQ
jgi:Flp pilus assembly pilin Flp